MAALVINHNAPNEKGGGEVRERYRIWTRVLLGTACNVASLSTPMSAFSLHIPLSFHDMMCWQKKTNLLVTVTNFNKYSSTFCYWLLHLGVLIRSPPDGFCLKAGCFLWVAAMAPSLSSPHTSHTIITLTEFAVLLDSRRRPIGATKFCTAANWNPETEAVCP
jgi:hypothetical protein